MRKTILMLTLLFTSLFAQTKEEEIAGIDAQIEQLTDQKNLYKASADRHQDEGDRWQFESGNLQDARQAWDEADSDREKMAEIQLEIDRLNQEKAKLQKP